MRVTLNLSFDVRALNQSGLSALKTNLMLSLTPLSQTMRYWIGRALPGMTKYNSAGSVAGTAGRVRYDAGDFEIPVEWFQRDISGGDERRTFKAWAANEATKDAGPIAGQTYSFNSTELRLISTDNPLPGDAVRLEMRALPPVGGAALNTVQHTAVRVSSRLLQVARPDYRNVAYRVHGQRADPPEQLWEISTGSERAVLDNCW